MKKKKKKQKRENDQIKEIYDEKVNHFREHVKKKSQ